MPPKYLPRNQEIKGIFFDLGGVIVKIDAYIRELRGQESLFMSVRERTFRQALRMEEARIERGEESTGRFFRRVTKRLGVEPLRAEVATRLLAAPFKKRARIDRGTLSISKRLMRSGYPVGVISNTIDDHVAIMKKWKLFGYFDPVILSNVVHARKPERKIFMLASKKMGIPPRNLLFIDDKAEWLRAARKYGFKTILFKSSAQLKKRLRKLRLLL